MSKFHLMHCIPNPRMHGLNGYKEVIDTVAWGLEQLGHDVSYEVNKSDPRATNIVFGAQVLPIEILKTLRDDTIVYNFEQMRGFSGNQIRPEARFYAKHFQVWDYSAENLQAWSSVADSEVRIVPVAYAPVLSRIIKPERQDIDVLIYGLSGPKRLNAFHALSRAGLSTLFASGFYGAARDELIARSKIVLNINLYDTSQIFEIVRVSFLLSNRKAVVANLDTNTAVEADIKSCVKFSRLGNLAAECIELIDSDAARIQLENSGFETFSQRDIREILRGALYG
jgi:hypothetical protein